VGCRQGEDSDGDQRGSGIYSSGCRQRGEALATIARVENREYAAPLFSAYASIENEYGEYLWRSVRSCRGKCGRGLYDYGPTLTFAGQNREPVAQDFPGARFPGWLGVLRTMPPAPGEEGVREKAAAVKDYDGKRNDLTGPSPELAQLAQRGVPQ